eukprot:Skav229454  [mRNA]  locus=scaffold397:312250:318842:+ [translate_table: standard]
MSRRLLQTWFWAGTDHLSFGAPRTARCVRMRPRATNVKTASTSRTPTGVIMSAQMATTSSEKAMWVESARCAKLLATPVLDLTCAQSTMAASSDLPGADDIGIPIGLCKQGMFLTPKGTCELSCPDGYWASIGLNGVGGTCAICPENCAECKAETTCTACTNNTYLHANECKDRCPDGWFHMGEDVSKRECVSCKPGCSQCSNETFCSECKDGLFLTPSGQCESACPDGFFSLPGVDGVGGVCQLCAENCTKCEWWDRCLECKASKYLTHYNWCTTACPAGYFEDGEGDVGRVCLECPENCNTCVNSQICCSPASFRH